MADSGSCDRERPSFPTCHTSKDAFLKIKELVQDLPVDGIGINDIVARVEWLVEVFKDSSGRHLRHSIHCYFQDGDWQCNYPCPKSRCVKAGCEGGVCCTPRYCIVEDHDSRIKDSGAVLEHPGNKSPHPNYRKP